MRTGGWSLLGVMSDWQRGVDWFLAKYCRCKLRLDWCWCRCRTTAKGRGRWGLHVWRRQVGLVRGTRWPAESGAGRMVARAPRWSRGRFLGWVSKPRWAGTSWEPSQEWWLAEATWWGHHEYIYTSSPFSYSSAGNTVLGTTFLANYSGPCKRVQLRHDAEEWRPGRLKTSPTGGLVRGRLRLAQEGA
jgi:hypothetical protein